MDSKKLALLCRELADHRKAENIVVLDVRELSSITDYFVIATGLSDPHLKAIVEEVEEGVEEQAGIRPQHVEGTWQGSWLVLDYFDVIVHIMRQEARERYNLESLWSDAPRVKAGRGTKRKSAAESAGTSGN